MSERFGGVRAALRAVGIRPGSSDFWIGGWTLPATDEAASRFANNPPTAILATDSLVALSALSAPRKAGLRVPEDLSVITFDSSPWSEAFAPAPSVVSRPVLGSTAACMLIER